MCRLDGYRGVLTVEKQRYSNTAVRFPIVLCGNPNGYGGFRSISFVGAPPVAPALAPIGACAHVKK